MHLGLLSNRQRKHLSFPAQEIPPPASAVTTQQLYPGEATECISVGLSLLHLCIEPAVELPRL